MWSHIMSKCYICGGNSIKIRDHTRDSDHSVYKCKICDTCFLYPIPDTTNYYQDTYWIDRDKMDYDAVYSDSLSEAMIRVDDVRSTLLIDDNTKMIEIGCGIGAFTISMSKYICIDAVEPFNEYRYWIRSNNDINIYSNIYEIDTYYDYGVLFHVLEHVTDPVEFIKTLLTKSGGLYIEIPNSNDVMLNNINYSNYFYQKAHIYYMNESSMRYIADMIGCEIDIRYKMRYNIGNHMYWYTHGIPGGNNKYPEIVNRLGNDYNNELIDERISDTMICILNGR